MKKTIMSLVFLAVGVLGVAAPASAEEKLVAPAATASTDDPAEFGSGYNSWSTRGGATLGSGNAARAQLNFGGLAAGGGVGAYAGGGWGYAGLDGMYYLNLGPDMDLGVGGRLPFYPFGIAPGAQFRWRLMNQGQFQLAFDGSLYIPFYFAGIGPAGAGTAAIGFSIEPGAMASYFLKDNMELYFGLILPLQFQTFTGFGFSSFSMFFNIRGGFVYTLKKSNIGLYGAIDLIPGFSAALSGPGGVNGGFAFNFTLGAQFKF